MKRRIGIALLLTAGPLCGETERRLSLDEYVDKMSAGWIGQMVGVSWAAPTEFKWKDEIIPLAKIPAWAPKTINDAFGQDDLYVEMTFVRTLEEYGLKVNMRQAGIDFANSEYPLWCANVAARNNLRRGIAPPDSSHPKFNKCPNDIDYQIEADFAGLLAPGMPNSVIEMGETFGRLMNYGDGLYGGQFMGAMYSEAFFTTDLQRIVKAGLAAIPAESQYAEMVRDLLKWSQENPDDWQDTWRLCLKKYRKEPNYQKASNGPIDVKINGAAVLLGLLYGKGEIEKTIVISMRAGWDSDCNPSSAAGVLFTTLGMKKVPPHFVEKLDTGRRFSFTAYSFPALIEACAKLARQVVAQQGGRLENGMLIIPVSAPKPSALELSWAPGPTANSLFAPDELAKIKCKAETKP